MAQLTTLDTRQWIVRVMFVIGAIVGLVLGMTAGFWLCGLWELRNG
jgi:hypothetical protein